MSKFLPGQSGNPNGRPRSRATRDNLRQIIRDELPDIVRVLIDQAKQGDIQAAKVLLDKVLPSLKPESDAVSFDIAENDSLASIGQSVIDATSRGDIAPDICSGMLSALAAQAKIIETTELLARIEALENQK